MQKVELLMYLTHENAHSTKKFAPVILTKPRIMLNYQNNLDVSALQTLISIDSISNNPPALFINGKAYYGFRDVEGIQKILPQLATLEKSATSTATTTAS